MEIKSGRRKAKVEMRYYELPEHEPVLALQGGEWVRVYGEKDENLHFHNLMEIGICHWGEGRLILDDRTIYYQKGGVTVIPQSCLHATVSQAGCKNYWAYLFFDPRQVLQRAFPDEPYLVEQLVQRLSSEAKYCSGETGQRLFQLVRLILEEYESEEERDYHTGMVQNLLTALVLAAARVCSRPEQTVHLDDGEGAFPGLRQIIPATEYIERFYMNPIAIGDLAAQCSMSEPHLRRKFKEYFRMSPGEYLTVVRIRHGCDLLNLTDYSMLEVALRVGYQSVSSFDRNFQRLIGLSPYRYKKERRNLKGRLLEYNITAKKGWRTIEDE